MVRTLDSSADSGSIIYIMLHSGVICSGIQQVVLAVLIANLGSSLPAICTRLIASHLTTSYEAVEDERFGACGGIPY